MVRRYHRRDALYRYFRGLEIPSQLCPEIQLHFEDHLPGCSSGRSDTLLSNTSRCVLAPVSLFPVDEELRFLAGIVSPIQLVHLVT